VRRAKWCALLLMGTMSGFICSAQDKARRELMPSKMPKIATVDPRFLSYNIEMVEVTGGRFWAPYKSASAGAPAAQPDPNQPAGLDPSLFQYRKPIDLSNARLRKLAEALGPAYVRVSGTWANSTFFPDSDAHAPTQPPEGFRGVLTRAGWKGVIDFSRSADALIVTSVAISSGVRNKEGEWTPDQAKLLFDYTRQAGGTIAATEFMNEPTIPGPGNAPKGYNAAAFARDAKLFGSFLRKESPKTVYLGPGSVGEGGALISPGLRMDMIKSDDILKGTGPIFDAFSYHFYGSVSKRCGGKMTVEKALTPEWLDSTGSSERFYAQLRDTYLPAKPMWLTETAEAACGGDPLAAQFVDTFRFLNQLGTLAQKGVKVVMHNTLAASDYGLLDETTLEPRPDYWAGVLWKRTMGQTVLNPQAPADAGIRVYAQCMKGVPGGVTLLALNTDPKEKHGLGISSPAERYTITSDSLTSTAVSLNGTPLHTLTNGSLPELKSERVGAGTLQLDPVSVTFLAIPSANNPACKEQIAQ
jgi:heparanase 1